MTPRSHHHRRFVLGTFATGEPADFDSRERVVVCRSGDRFTREQCKRLGWSRVGTWRKGTVSK